MFSHYPQLSTQGNAMFFHLTSIPSVQIGLLCAFHTCFDSEADVQTRQMYQKQEEYFPFALRYLSKQHQNASEVRRAAMCYFNSNHVIKGSVVKILDLGTWPQWSECCIWDFFGFFLIILMEILKISRMMKWAHDVIPPFFFKDQNGSKTRGRKICRKLNL